MKEGFLEREAKQAHKKNRKLFLTLLLVYVLIVGVLTLALKNTMDLSSYEDKKIVVYLCILSGIMLLSIVFGLIVSSRGTGNGKSLILPFEEGSKESVGRIIDREVEEGKVLVDEYIEKFSEGAKARGERVLLTESYLLLFQGMGRVRAIPRSRIYWICAQTGVKGRSSFIVRLLVFTEKQTFSLEGTDIAHVEEIAEKLYRYIPDIFREYDHFALSYRLEELFDKNREAFLSFYEEEKKKYGKDVEGEDS